MEATRILLIFAHFLIFFGVFDVASGSRSCPNLKPVPIDENFFFGRQPADGFYVAYGSGEDSMPSYSPKRMNSGLKGSHAVCLRTRVVVSGRDMLAAPPVDCSYKDSVSAIFCESAGGGPAEAAVNAVGFRIPKTEIGVVVDTDNSTYVAWGLCMDGAAYAWLIFTVDPSVRTVYSSSAKALNVTGAEVKLSEDKKLKTGRTRITKGPCPSVSKVSAGVDALKGGLSGLFGG